MDYENADVLWVCQINCVSLADYLTHPFLRLRCTGKPVNIPKGLHGKTQADQIKAEEGGQANQKKC